MVDVADGERTRRSVSAVGRRQGAYLTSFVGRESALDRLRQELGAHRLVTLTGPGGVGRRAWPRPSSRTGTTRRTSSSSRASPTPRRSRRPSRPPWASPTSRTATPRTASSTTWRGPSLLLVVDNCEHLLDGTVRAAPPARGAAGPHRARDEPRRARRRGRAGPPARAAAVPGDPAARRAPSLDDVPAVRLLLDRARHVLPDFAITDHQPRRRRRAVPTARRSASGDRARRGTVAHAVGVPGRRPAGRPSAHC